MTTLFDPPNTTPLIRAAWPDEGRGLSELALRSKGHWGHDAAFLERCREELTVPRAAIENGDVHVAERDVVVAGFHRLAGAELVALFVTPEWIGRGVGRALLDHARELARSRGVERLTIESDPDAEPFYLGQGARRVGERISRSTGRTLPLLELRS